MKINHLQEGSEASMPTPGQPPMRSARDPKVLETSAGATGSGSVATVSSPVGAMQTRNSSIYGKTPKGSMLKGIKTSKKYANSAHVSESHIPLSKIDPPDHGEPEGDFVKNQLHTIKRVTTHLERIVGNNEDLPEWVEMKISQAQGMMVAIMGYMVSSKEREVERQTGKEGMMAEGAKVDRMVKHVKSSEKKLGKSNKEAENIAWATANKRGMLDNKNKKEDAMAEGELNTSYMNKANKDFYDKNPNFKRSDRETATVGNKIASKVTPSSSSKVTKKPMSPFGNQGVAEGYDEDDECNYCHGTGEGQFDGQTCSHCHGSGVNPSNRDDDFDDFDLDDDIFEDVIDEEVLAKKLAKQLELFKHGVDKDLGSKPKAKDLGKKPTYTNTLESVSKGSLPGAVSGIKIMSPEEFVKGDEEVDEDVSRRGFLKGLGALGAAGAVSNAKAHTYQFDNDDYIKLVLGEYLIAGELSNRGSQAAVKSALNGIYDFMNYSPSYIETQLSKRRNELTADPATYQKLSKLFSSQENVINLLNSLERIKSKIVATMTNDERQYHINRLNVKENFNKDVLEATKLPAQQRELGGKEFQDYMNRIKGTDDIDKKTGQVKLDKKGIPKYTSGKTKTDKYKMPYVHRSSAIEYLTPDGKSFSEDAIKNAILQRPKSLLKQNEKMKHSNGELEQFFNVGFAALTGIAVDESTGKLIIVNTCPGAGSCKVDCFAMKGGKVQFKAAWLSDARILTYLLNDPSGFFQQLSSEISKEEALGKKGGYRVTVRWHDAGDFFSPEYMNLAFKMASAHPDVKFYAYTKIAGAALGSKPNNFIVNWSEGANTQQEKQIKAQDPNLDTTKNSRIIPEKLFYDLLAKDEKGNLKKTADGAWQPASPEALDMMKDRLAKAYNLKRDSILSYDEMMNTPMKNNIKKWNVIIAPGEGDISANRQDVLSTLLLRH